MVPNPVGVLDTESLPPKSSHDCNENGRFLKLGLNTIKDNPNDGGVQIPDGHGVFVHVSLPCLVSQIPGQWSCNLVKCSN